MRKNISRFNVNELINTTETSDVFLCIFGASHTVCGKNQGENLFAKVEKHKHHRKEAMLCSVCCLIIGKTIKIEKILRAHAGGLSCFALYLICILMVNFSVFRYATLILFAFLLSHAKCFS